MNKQILILSIIVLTNIAFSQKVSVPSMPSPNDSKTSKTQWGIIGTCTAWYMKVRTCVRYCYDEIKYWEGTVNSYQKLNKWFSTNKNFVKSLSNSTTRIFSDPKNVFVTLERLEDTFDGIDHLYEQSFTFDSLMYGIENSFDKFAADTFIYTINMNTSASCTLSHTAGLLIPNTGQVLSFIDDKMFGNSSSGNISINKGKNITINDSSEIRQVNSIPDSIVYDWPESRLKYSNEIIVSNALAHSAQYRMWSQRAMSRMDKIDSLLSSAANCVNGKEMSAAWYALDNVNANNKKLRHSIEEAKLFQATLGTELYYKTLKRSQVFKQSYFFNN